MSDRILSLKQVAEEGIVPLSKSSLYRVAEEGGEDSPFRKRQGRWMTVESDLLRWVREGQRGIRRTSGDPMPQPHRSRPSSLLADVHELRKNLA